MGLAGIMAKPFQNALSKDRKTSALLWAILGASLAIAVRYFWHFVAGVLFWGSYAPEGMSPYWYSFTVNGTAGLLTLIFVIIALVIIVPSQGKIFLTKNK